MIGNDLSLVKDSGDKPVPLQEYLARGLTRRLDTPYTGQWVSELAAAYPSANIMLTTHSLYNKMDADRFHTEPLEKLAEITDFKLYISTSLDDLLEKALRKARNLKKNELKVLNYSLQQFSDPPTSGDEEEEPPVTVFNLLGSLENITESAFTDEAIMEHFFSFSGKQGRPPLADYFMQQIKNKILLFIGCDFPDWFMRFIIRILTNQRYKFRLFSDYIVNDDSGRSPHLNRFLEQNNKNVIRLEGTKRGNAQVFIDELHERWAEFLENRPIQYDGSVFLSYNHPDQDKVKALKKRLKAKGIRNVWFDVDDLASGEHQTLIDEEIKKCKVFIPLISNNSLSNNESYTWKVEWAGIESRLMADKYYGKMSVRVIPVVLDDTPRNDERIPGFMRDFSIWELETNKDRIVEEIANVLTPL
ncbi:MAG: TIR domain-containing protein [bacterium]|nr:TIR domain-containing protein [bacterium]